MVGIGAPAAPAVPVLIKLLDDPDEDRRANAAKALAGFGPLAAPAVPALIKLLGSDADVGYDGQVTGLGVDYGTVLHMLHYLSRHDSLNADFIVEQPNLADMVGPPRRIGRPESEL